MGRLRFFGVVVVAVGLLGLTVACQRPAPDTRAADEQAIRQADMDWSDAAQAKDLERTLAFYADDASAFPSNAPIATGKPAIRAVWSSLVATPGFSLRWRPTRVEASRAGDLGYSVGTYEFAMNDPKGKPITDRGKYVVVWKKQPDGTWKVIADIFNSDLPPPGTQ